MTTATDTLTVLVIDDDNELYAMIQELFSREKILAQHAASAAQGLAMLTTDPPDVVVLDLMLPDASGLEVCRRVRAGGSTMPILMLSARGDPMDRVLGLEMGTDDYLAKPFEPRELVARVRALSRRAAQSGQTQWRFDGITLDLLAHRVLCGDAPLTLTSSEFKLLVALAAEAGRPIARAALSLQIQPGDYVPLDRAVDVQIARIRKKIPRRPDGREWIDTVRGEGYVFTGRRL